MKCTKCHRDAPNDALFCPYCAAKLRPDLEHIDFEYAAFISYRHLARDTEVAKQVQRAIETYKLPRSISQNAGSRRLGKCFRDEDELTVASSLPDRILEALSKSSALVVVCTPDTKGSIWVQREVSAFTSMHGSDRVFTVLAAGSSADSIPDYLKSDDSQISSTGETHSSPLASDMRPEASGRKREETLRLVAAIANCGFDELKQRDLVRRRKRATVTALAAILVVAVIAVAIALASSAQQNALANESRRLASESERLFSQGDRYGALQTALDALSKSKAASDDALAAKARQALVDALELELVDRPHWQPAYLVELNNEAVRLITAPDRNWFAVLDSSINVSVYEYTSGKKLSTFSPLALADDESFPEIDSSSKAWRIEPVGDYIMVVECAGSGVLAAYEAKTGELKWNYSPAPVRGVTTSFNKTICDLLLLSEKDSFIFACAPEESRPLAAKLFDNSEQLQSNLFFVPTVALDNGLVFAGIGNRVISCNLVETDEPISMSDASDLEYTSICQTEDTIVTSSASLPSEEPRSLSGYEREYRFESFDQELNALWSYGGTWAPRYEGEGPAMYATFGEPQVHGAVYFDQAYTVCTVGNTLLLFDVLSGNLSYTEQFGSTIISTRTDGVNKEGQSDVLVVTCADGSVSFRSLFADWGELANRLNFSFPSEISESFVEWTSEKKLMAVAISHRQPNKILGYCLDMRGVLGQYAGSFTAQRGLYPVDIRYLDEKLERTYKTISSYSDDELTALAHKELAEGGYE